MTKYLAIRTKTGVRFYELGKNPRPLTIVKQRLFRTDEAFMVVNDTSPTEFVMYDLDSTIPYCTIDPPAPDETLAYIDVGRSSKKNAAKISAMDWLSIEKLTPLIVVVAVAYGLISGYMG